MTLILKYLLLTHQESSKLIPLISRIGNERRIESKIDRLKREIPGPGKYDVRSVMS
jgi:hypothetical protein